MEVELCGYMILIDDEDHLLVVKNKWSINQTDLKKRGLVYFKTWYFDSNKKQHTPLLHRLIMNLKINDGKIVDHINRDTLDNRKSNLRIVTKSQNAMNSKVKITNKSGYKGVWTVKGNKGFVGEIIKDGIKYYLGTYNTPQEAHAAYCKASKTYHGEFGRTE